MSSLEVAVLLVDALPPVETRATVALGLPLLARFALVPLATLAPERDGRTWQFRIWVGGASSNATVWNFLWKLQFSARTRFLLESQAFEELDDFSTTDTFAREGVPPTPGSSVAERGTHEKPPPGSRLHTPLFLQGCRRQKSIFWAQFLPVNPCLHLHLQQYTFNQGKNVTKSCKQITCSSRGSTCESKHH